MNMCSWCGARRGHEPNCLKARFDLDVAPPESRDHLAPYDQEQEVDEWRGAQEGEELAHLDDREFDARMVAERERAEPTSRALWELFFHGCILKGCGHAWADELLVELGPQFAQIGVEDDDD